MIDKTGVKPSKRRIKHPGEPRVIKKNWTYYLDVLDNQNWEGPISQGSISISDTLWYDPSRHLIDKENDLFVETGISLQQGQTEADILIQVGYRLLDLNEDLSPPREVASELDRGIYEDN